MYENNVYYNPETYGLTIIGEVSWSEPPYGFDFTLVLMDEKGKLWWGRDSGCSCPEPFENHEFPNDFLSGTLDELIASLYLVLKAEDAFCTEEEYEYSSNQIARIVEQCMLRRIK